MRSDAERAEVRQRSQEISMELIGMPGFIGFIGVDTPSRMFTITAWEEPGAPAAFAGQGLHAHAVKDFFGQGFGGSGTLSVWQPERIRQLTRCEECGKVGQVPGGACPQGHQLAPGRYF